MYVAFAFRIHQKEPLHEARQFFCLVGLHLFQYLIKIGSNKFKLGTNQTFYFRASPQSMARQRLAIGILYTVYKYIGSHENQKATRWTATTDRNPPTKLGRKHLLLLRQVLVRFVVFGHGGTIRQLLRDGVVAAAVRW